MKPVRIGDFLHRVKDVVSIDDNTQYKRLTIKTKNQGVSLRDEVLGNIIGTKSQFRVKANQFILSKIDARWGAFGIVPESLDGAIATPDFPAFEFDAQMVSPLWFNLFTSSSRFTEICKAASRGVTNRQRLSEDFFLNYKILLPSKPEQDNIVARLQSLQALHREADATLARLQTNVKRLRQSILQEAIQGKLVDYKPAPGEKTGAELLADIRAEKERCAREAGKKPEAPLPPVTPEEMPFEVPEGWVWCRLGEVADVIDPNPSHRMPEYVLKGVPFISTDNFNIDKTIDFERGKKVTEITLQEHIERYEILDTSFAFSRIGTIGKTVKLPTSRNYCLSHSLCVITPTPQSINSDYLQFVMSSEFVLLQATNGVRSISVPDLGMARIRQFVIPLPRITEQSKIVDVVNAQLSQLTLLDQQLAALQTKTERLWKSELQQTFKFENTE